MIKALSTPGSRGATAFLMVFGFAVLFALVRLVAGFVADGIAPLDDIPGGVQTVINVALGVLLSTKAIAKFSPAVKAGVEPS